MKDGRQQDYTTSTGSRGEGTRAQAHEPRIRDEGQGGKWKGPWGKGKGTRAKGEVQGARGPRTRDKGYGSQGRGPRIQV